MEEQKKTVSFGAIVKVIGGILILAFLIIAIKNMLSSNKDANIASNVAINQGDVQVVNLGFRNGNYYPNRIEVEAGKAVRLVADLNQISGCARSIIIQQLGIRKMLKTGDNIIEFTPTKKGVIPFSCVMGMYTGQIIVK